MQRRGVYRDADDVIYQTSTFLLITKVKLKCLTLLFLQTKSVTFANSVDQDETALIEPSHLDLHCLPFCFGFCADSAVFHKARVLITNKKSLLKW